MEIYGINASDVLLKGIKAINAHGSEVVVRGQLTKELTGVTIHIANPTQRCLLLSQRNDSIFAKVAEAVWMLAGRNELDWLETYLPRCKEFSDDGVCWRAGYGPRLRNWEGVDQINQCMLLLQQDPSTRRAVMNLWDPSKDYCDSKDIPCNNWIHWLIRETPSGLKMLHMNISQRSADLIWGFSGIDAFAWSYLHQMMAHWTGCEVGEVHWFISSLHIYERHYAKADKILQANDNIDPYTHINGMGITMNPVNFRVDPITALDNLKVMSGYPMKQTYPKLVFKMYRNGLLGTSLRMLWIYNRFQEKSWDTVASLVSTMEFSDFKLAALEYLGRAEPSLRKLFLLDKNEQKIMENFYGWKTQENYKEFPT